MHRNTMIGAWVALVAFGSLAGCATAAAPELSSAKHASPHPSAPATQASAPVKASGGTASPGPAFHGFATPRPTPTPDPNGPLIGTFAGTGKGTSYGDETTGDGGPATAAELYTPSAVAVDAAGNLFIADYFGHTVRKVAPDGTISTYAGGGPSKVIGGPATGVQLGYPDGLAVDPAGNLFIADNFLAEVLKVTPAGVIGVYVGGGTARGDGGQATAERLGQPKGLAVDPAGNLYVADFGFDRVSKVTPAGIISTVIGTTQAPITMGGGDPPAPRPLPSDPNWGDGGPAAAAQLNEPTGIALDAEGDLFVSDSTNGRVREVTPDGIIHRFAGKGGYGDDGAGGPASAATFGPPGALATDKAGNLYITDSDNSQIWRVAPDGIITILAGTGDSGDSGDGGLAAAAQLTRPEGVAVDGTGRVFIADTGNRKVRVVRPRP